MENIRTCVDGSVDDLFNSMYGISKCNLRVPHCSWMHRVSTIVSMVRWGWISIDWQSHPSQSPRYIGVYLPQPQIYSCYLRVCSKLSCFQSHVPRVRYIHGIGHASLSFLVLTVDADNHCILAWKKYLQNSINKRCFDIPRL